MFLFQFVYFTTYFGAVEEHRWSCQVCGALQKLKVTTSALMSYCFVENEDYFICHSFYSHVPFNRFTAFGKNRNLAGARFSTDHVQYQSLTFNFPVNPRLSVVYFKLHSSATR